MQRTDCAARMFHPFSRSGGSGSSGNRMMNIWLSGSRHMLRIDRRPRACQGMAIYSQHVSRKSNATRNARYGDRNGLRRTVALRDRARWRSIIARLAPRESATRPRRSAALVPLCTDNGGTAKAYVVYCASSMALAQLEQLVHISRELAPVDIVSIAAVVPNDAIETVDVARLPSRWRDEPPPFELSAIGDRCVRTARSLALRVPSAVAPDDWNVVLNPAHERFGEITIETPREVKLDPRLFG